MYKFKLEVSQRLSQRQRQRQGRRGGSISGRGAGLMPLFFACLCFSLLCNLVGYSLPRAHAKRTLLTRQPWFSRETSTTYRRHARCTGDASNFATTGIRACSSRMSWRELHLAPVACRSASTAAPVTRRLPAPPWPSHYSHVLPLLPPSLLQLFRCCVSCPAQKQFVWLPILLRG
jgi:hypothetical protein